MYSRGCSHNEIEICHTTGTEVCRICGLVVSENLSYSECHQEKFMESIDRKTYEIEDNNIESFLDKIAQRLNLSDYLCTLIHNLYKRLIHDMESIPSKQKQKQELIVYCVYITLRKENTPRSIRELVAVSDVLEKNVWKIEKYYAQKANVKTSKKILSPRDVICTYYSYLNLEFLDLKEMLDMVVETPVKISFSPTSIAGGILYLYSKKIGKKYSMKYIADLIHTTPMSIYRFIRAFPTS